MANKPLAEKVRPQRIDQFVGQKKILDKHSFLRQAIKADQVPSMIFWGPPGTGKTTLAAIIANETQSSFVKLSATRSGKADLVKVITAADKFLKEQGKRTILFIDEIHRWNKAQQDTLLPVVENGTLTLIGATTENPSFEVNSALVSRCRIFVLEELTAEDLKMILKRALKLEKVKVSQLEKGVLDLIANFANGDARNALNVLEACLNFAKGKKISLSAVKDVLQKQHLFYDKNSEEHYNIISALHKSMRGGDADAALYWLCRMLAGGEDPLYIARRLVRFASEDVGLANNTALILANGTFEACHKLGMPECGVNLAHCVVYLAKSAKSIAVYEGYKRAMQDVEQFGNLPVPLHIRNAPTKLMKDLGYGKGYKYTPKEDSSKQEYFPERLRKRRYV